MSLINELNNLFSHMSEKDKELANQNQYAYLFSKAFLFLKQGPIIYRKHDFFHQPPADLSADEILILQNGCRQILSGKGLSAESPFTNLGIQGFSGLLQLFHFEKKDRSSKYGFKNDDLSGVLDCITFQHIMEENRITTLYNFCVYNFNG
jgi:hypothetical protein